jgi:ATP/maltotriose-dependent transcriptional regulator MalT
VDLIAAQMALSRGDRREARTRATAALTLAGRDYPDIAIQARQTLALNDATSGATKQGLTLVADAVRAARQLKLPRLLSTVLLGSAEVRLAAGQPGPALADAQEAQKMFSPAEQLESEWRAWLVSARCVQTAGDRSTASEYAVRADTARAALKARWGEDHYGGYARRPDIRARLAQLEQLLGAQTVVQRTGGDHGSR